MDLARRPSFKLESADRSTFLQKQTFEVQEKKSKKSKKSSSGEEIESTPIHRHAKYADHLAETPSEDIKNLSDAFQYSAKKYADRQALGTRQKNADGTFGEYKFITWGEVATRVKNFSAGLRSVCELSKGDKVGIYAKNRVEWFVSMESANANGIVTVALYDTFGAENLTYVVNHSELTTVIASIDRIQNFLQLVDGMKGVKHLVTMDYDDEEKISTLKKLAKKHGIKLHTFAEIEEKGTSYAGKKSYRLPEVDKDDLSVIMYTSGTTGNPKGAMITHGNILAMLASVPDSMGGLFPTDCYISYLPLAHIFERVVITAVAFFGGRVGFYQGDVTKLTEDMQALKPSILAAAPRVLNRIYQRINANVKAAGGLKQKLFKMGLKSKEKSISKHKNKGGFDFVFKKPKSVTGGNLRLVVSGSAPLTPDVQSFVRSVLGCPVVQGYGLTETCAGCSVAAPDDVDCVGEVGPMLACAEVKLVSCPELNYLAKDNKGEVWIRGNNVCKGYYKDEEKTKEDFDADGWFHTGDIGEFTARGTLKIIDRKKNIFKLSQGEYVAAEVLENIYLKHPFVDQIWVHGDSTQSTLVAVINVNQANCIDWAHKNGCLPKSDNPIKDLIKDDAMKKAILQALSEMARAEKRAGYEVIKRCHLIDYEFSAENDFATPTAKLKRPQLRAAFKAEIDAMYKEIAAEETNPGAGAAPAAASKGADKGKAKDDGKTATQKSTKPADKPAETSKSADKGKKKAESSEETSESSGAAKKPAAKKKPADSESDGDVPTSSEDSAPAKKSASSKQPTKKDDSSSDSSDESSDDKPAKKTPEVKKAAAPAKKAAESSSSDESSSSSEAPAKKSPEAKKAAAPAKKAAESSSSDDSSSSEAPAKKSAAPAKKIADSSSESSTSEEKPPVKKAATPAKAPVKKAAADSSDSSSSSEEKTPAKKAAPSKAPAKKPAASSSSSDSDSSSEEQKPVKKAAAKAPAKKVESSSDSSSESSSSDEKPAKKAPPKKK